MSQEDSLGKAIDIGLLITIGSYSAVWGIIERDGLKVAGNNWQYF